MARPVFFKTAADLRRWLTRRHATARELLVGFYKKGTGVPSITYHEALDAALCFGWIDGLVRSMDAKRYTIRFTPRTASSRWSRVNIARARKLKRQGLMAPAGLRAFEHHRRTAYSYEHAPSSFDAASLRAFRAARKAWAFFETQPPSYRRVTTFFVMSAVKPETRARRLAGLIDCCEKGERIGILARKKPKGA